MTGGNGRRASYGRAAVAVGTPHAGHNGEDLSGFHIDSADAIACILHAVAERAERDLEMGPGGAALVAFSVLESAREEFDAARAGGGAEVPEPPAMVVVVRDQDEAEHLAGLLRPRGG